MQTVSGVTELFFLAVLATLFWATIQKQAATKTVVNQRILILSLAVSLTADALRNLLFTDSAAVWEKILAAVDLPALYASFTALFLFAVFAVEEKKTCSKAFQLIPMCFCAVFSAAWIVSVLTGFSFPFGGGAANRYFVGAFCFLPLVFGMILAVWNAKILGVGNAAALLVSCALPAAMLPFEAVFGLPFVRVSAVVSMLVTEFSMAKKEQYEYAEKARDLAEKQLELNQSQTRIMISQIQPHFLYNSLATIGYVCQKDAGTASRALDAFAEYLRMNLTAITSETTIPFNQELEHIKTYLWLEKMRFEERLNTVFVIEATDFSLPALSVQPLVENAVKHGLCEKKDGGTLTIRTIEYEDSFVIQIEDDGVGFDVNRYGEDGKLHVGIANVKSRLKSMCNATLEIKSGINKGTTATIRLPKERT